MALRYSLSRAAFTKNCGGDSVIESAYCHICSTRRARRRACRRSRTVVTISSGIALSIAAVSLRCAASTTALPARRIHARRSTYGIARYSNRTRRCRAYRRSPACDLTRSRHSSTDSREIVTLAAVLGERPIQSRRLLHDPSVATTPDDRAVRRRLAPESSTVFSNSAGTWIGIGRARGFGRC